MPDTAKEHKHRHKNIVVQYLEFVPFWCMYSFVRLLSLKAAYTLSAALIPLVYIFDAKHRKRTISHLLHAGVAKTRAEAVKLAKECYRQYGELIVEIVKMDQCYDLKKITLGGDPDTLRDFMVPETRIRPDHIVATAHYGNWEVAGRAYSETVRVHMTSIMRPFDNALIGKMILGHRACATHTLSDKKLGIRPALKALQRKELFTVLIDQHASSREGVETVFFGHPCRTHMTPALLHLKTGVPIVPEVTRRLPGKDFRFELVVGKAIQYTPTGDKEKDIAAVCQMCTSELEKLIAADPVQWMWAHRRWLDADGRTR